MIYLNDQACGVDTFDTGALSLAFGAPCWSDHLPEDVELRTCPLICVSTATGGDWADGTQEAYETWIYFHDRRSWRGAYRLARIMLRDCGQTRIPKGFAGDLGGLETTAIVGRHHRLDIA